MRAWDNVVKPARDFTRRGRLILYVNLANWTACRGDYRRAATWCAKGLELYPKGHSARELFEGLKLEMERQVLHQEERTRKNPPREVISFDRDAVKSERSTNCNETRLGERSGARIESDSDGRWSWHQHVLTWWRIAKFHFFMYLVQRAKRRRAPLQAAHWLRKCIKLTPSRKGSAVISWALHDDLAGVLTDAGRHDEAEEAWILARKAQRETEKK